METGSQTGVTQLLVRWKAGDRAALDAIMPMVESELRRLAANFLRGERSNHTLQPTALVNELWLRISDREMNCENRSHFIAIAATSMRHILVEHARRKGAQKRGPAMRRADITDAGIFADERSADLIAIDDGMRDLEKFNPRQARVVELHYFGGLTFEEVADVVEIARSTVIRDLRMAQVWLRQYLEA